MRQGSHSPNAIAAFSVILLRHDDRYLLLRRAATKRFAPGKWTGLGGRVEPAEIDDLRSAALRELAEETGIGPDEVAWFALRRALLHARPADPSVLTVLLYFTGVIERSVPPTSREGTLAWVAADDLGGLDLVDNAREALPLIVDDERRDPRGTEPVRLGVAVYRSDGTLERIVWG